MKKILLILFLATLVSCYRSHNIYIKNVSRDIIYLNTEKAIESEFAIKRGSLYDSIITKKINTSDLNGLYRINPNQSIFLFGGIGKKPSDTYFPFTKVELIKGLDTIIINENNFAAKINRQVKNFCFIELK